MVHYGLEYHCAEYDVLVQKCTKNIISHYTNNRYILLHDWEGNSYRGIFSSGVAVLARPQGGTIHNLRLNIPLYCPTKRECDLLYDSNSVGASIKK